MCFLLFLFRQVPGDQLYLPKVLYCTKFFIPPPIYCFWYFDKVAISPPSHGRASPMWGPCLQAVLFISRVRSGTRTHEAVKMGAAAVPLQLLHPNRHGWGGTPVHPLVDKHAPCSGIGFGMPMWKGRKGSSGEKSVPAAHNLRVWWEYLFCLYTCASILSHKVWGVKWEAFLNPNTANPATLLEAAVVWC